MKATHFFFHTHTLNNAAFAISIGNTLLRMEKNWGNTMCPKGKCNRTAVRNNLYTCTYSFI